MATEHNTTRRALLKGAPAAVLAMTATSAAAFQKPDAPTDDLPDWFDRWKHLRSEQKESGFDSRGEETAYGERLYDEIKALEAKIASTPARTQRGACAQVDWVLSDSHDFDFQPNHRDALELALASMRQALA